MRKLKILVVAAAVSVPSMAHACDLHGDFGGFGSFGGFGGMHYSNMSLLNDQRSTGYSSDPASADHGSSQGGRHVRFGASADTFDDETIDDGASGNEPVQSAYNPEDAATFR